MIRVLIILLITLNVQLCFSQNKQAILTEANYYYDISDFYTAKYYYEQAYELDSLDLNIVWGYAEACRNTNNYKLASILYKKVIELDKKSKFLEAYLWQGIMCKYLEEYDKANLILKKYIDLNLDPFSFNYKKALVEIKGVELALEMTSKKDSIFPLDQNINSKYSDFAPFPVGDSIIYFSSLTKIDGIENEHLFMHQSKMFKSKQNELSNELSIFNSLNFHVGNISFNSNYDKVYFTKCKSDENAMSCVIFSSKKKNGIWEEPIPMRKEINQVKTNNTHPQWAYWKGREGIFFSSNRDGGYGNMDIWFASDEDGEAENLGNIINTLGNEVTPFYCEEEKKIYFSSDFHPGIGGYDIFESNWNSYWDKATNIRRPLNSSHNDLYYVSKKNSPLKGYLTSNRKGSLFIDSESCCNDIYEFLKYEKCVCKEIDSLENKMQSQFPIALYFDNDQPNPNSRDTISLNNYQTTYELYLKEKENYISKYSSALVGKLKIEAKNQMKDFFNVFVKQGFLDLKIFAYQLKLAVQYNVSIQINIKGFASPLNDKEYNMSIAKRRISSLKNYLREFQDGYLSPHIDSGKITFFEIPFGESKASEQISDNPNDRTRSVFSIKAASERRIEIQAISIEQDNEEVN